MTSRQRVLAALNHRKPDRFPVDFGASYATGLTVAAYTNVRRALGLGSDPPKIVDPVQMLAEVELPVLDALGTDVVGLRTDSGHRHGWYDWRIPQGPQVLMPRNVEVRRRRDGGWDQYIGNRLVNTMAPGSWYFDPVEYPAWRVFRTEDFGDDLLRSLEERSGALRRSSDRALLFNSPFAVSNSTSADFLRDLLTEKEEAHERLEAWADSAVACLKPVLDAIRGSVDVITFSGDAGTQAGPLFGPELYGEMIVPHMRKITEYVHKHSGMKCFLHSCGSVYRLIGCFIDMGMDVVNPLQVSAAEMDPLRLVGEFGGQIVFWGGGCDTQQVLPGGTVEEVRREVRLRLDAFTKVPGYVFSQVHNVQPDVPAENFLAVVDEVRGYRH